MPPPVAALDLDSVDFDGWCTRMGLENKGDLYIFHRESGRSLGKLYFCLGAQTYPSGCRSHKDCKTIVTPKSRALACQKDLAQWLLQGMLESCSQADHAKQARDLKLKYGMKPRGRAV